MAQNEQPPQFALFLFRLLCHPDFKEEIEGDLLEKFENDCQNKNRSAAARNFRREVFQLIRWNIVFNIRPDTAPTKKWISLLAVILLLVAISSVPFIPGPYSKLAIGASALVQMAGFFGLVLIPVGLIWLFMDFRKSNDGQVSRWKNGYYPSLLVSLPVLCFLFLLLVLAFPEMNGMERGIAVTFIAGMATFLALRIQRLKNKVAHEFNTAPLYLVLIPLVAFCAKNFWIEKIADTSRDKAIVRSGEIIEALEKYRSVNGVYPVSLDELKGKYITAIPDPGIIGIKPYQYEKTGDSYVLLFVQWLHWGATEEKVIYCQPAHQLSVKGHFASFDTHYPGWRYYWND